MSNYLPIRSEREVKMQPVIRYGTAVVVIHAIVGTLHILAHIAIPVALSPLQILFVGSAIVLAPIVATVLLWTRFQQSRFNGLSVAVEKPCLDLSGDNSG